jgi:hypothetical protein
MSRPGRSPILGLIVAALLVGAPASSTDAAEARYCVTVRSEEPIEGDLLEAVAAGRASITIEAAEACAIDIASVPSPGASPVATDDPSLRRGSARQLLASLQVAPEDAAGYERNRFRHWVDTDGDGCDAREEVLISESLTEVSLGDGCRVTDGRWHSAFDDMQSSDASDLDIDHVVPLAEAWRSGARAWDDAQRRAYANDLLDDRVLRAVSASSNRSKGDQDPSQWLPPDESFGCEYASDWVAIKIRWSLAIDQAERTSLEDILSDCPPTAITVTLAASP